MKYVIAKQSNFSCVGSQYSGDSLAELMKIIRYCRESDNKISDNKTQKYSLYSFVTGQNKKHELMTILDNVTLNEIESYFKDYQTHEQK